MENIKMGERLKALLSHTSETRHPVRCILRLSHRQGNRKDAKRGWLI